MKTVSGKVLSTQPVSLSQAAKTIAAFVSADNGGASQAVAAYLKRTSAAFNELVQLHKDHKTPNFKIKKSRRVDGDQVRAEGLENGGRKKEKRKKEVVEGIEGNLGNVKNIVESEGRKDKEKEEKIEDGLGNLKKDGDFERKKEKRKKKSSGQDRGEDGLRIEEQPKEKKKRKNEEIDAGEIGNSAEQSGHKKKRRRAEGGN